jgi:hypothetical protein
MDFSWTFFREKIVIGAPFLSEMAKDFERKQIPTDSTILLAAKDIEFFPNAQISYSQFKGEYDIVIITDSFNGKGGKIDLSTRIMKEGKNGMDIILLCVEAIDVNIVSNGGTGRSGPRMHHFTTSGPGGNGGKISVVFVNGNPKDFKLSAKGGQGGVLHQLGNPHSIIGVESNGTDTDPIVDKISINDFWPRIRPIIGDSTARDLQINFLN